MENAHKVKAAPKPPIDRLKPIVRTETVTPERFADGPRANTSRAALMQPPPSMTKMRKGQLTNVQLLPSKKFTAEGAPPSQGLPRGGAKWVWILVYLGHFEVLKTYKLCWRFSLSSSFVSSCGQKEKRGKSCRYRRKNWPLVVCEPMLSSRYKILNESESGLGWKIHKS